jgi:hypothetical protein
MRLQLVQHRFVRGVPVMILMGSGDALSQFIRVERATGQVYVTGLASITAGFPK